MRYLHMMDFAEINRMTLYEFEMRMRASDLRRVDREYEIHLQAWANWNVQAMKKSGKRKRVPVFKTFKQFFDYKKAELEILNPQKRKSGSSRSQKIIQGIEKQKERRNGRGKL